MLQYLNCVCVCGAGCLQALLLHGSLSDDEQEVSLGLGEGVENAEQQLVRLYNSVHFHLILKPCLFLFFSFLLLTFFSLFF